MATRIGRGLLAPRSHRGCAGPLAQLEEFTGRVSDSGEGRWTILSAVESGAPAPVLSTALFERLTSQGEGAFANKLLYPAMRSEFGGHDEKTS